MRGSKKLFFFTVLAVASLLAPASAQDKAVSASKVERKNAAPVSKDVLRVKLPRPVEATLENGASVMIMEDHRFPTVYVQINISGSGPLFEPGDMPGVANITAQMLREGTKTRTSLRISQDIDRLGATLGASSGFGSSATVVSASGLSDNFDDWFGLATDILLNPAFPADELNRLRDRLKVQLRQQRASAGFLAAERFNAAVYGSHPGSVIAPTPAALDAMTPEVLAKWHRERYAPQNAIIGIAGDVRASEVVPKLRRWLDAWRKTDLREVLPPDPKPIAAKKIFLVDRPSSVQATMTLGNIAIDRRHADYVPLTVMNRVVGDGPASRLFINLREEKGYTYGAYSSFTALKYSGPWRAGADMRTEAAEGALTEFLNEIRRIREDRVPVTELEDSKRAVVAGFALSLEDSTQLLSYAITGKIYGFPADYWDTYPAKIMAVTPDDVQRVARKYVDPDRIQVVTVGDAAKLKPVLEKFGPVELWGADGTKKN